MNSASAAKATVIGRRSRRRRRRVVYLATAQLTAVLILLLPIIWMYVASFRPDLDTQSGRLWPRSWTLGNYSKLFAEPTVKAGLVNSLIVSASSAAISTFVASLAAYSLARFRMPGRRPVTALILLALVVPPLTLLVPLVVGLEKVHLTNNLVGLTIAYLILGVPIGTMLLRSYVLEIPVGLEEAATIDGASRIKTFWYITLPLLRPAIATVYVFAFILGWGEYLLALSLQTSDSEKTLPLVMQTLFDQHTFSIGEITAFGVLISLPVAVLFMLIQRNLVANLVAGGVK